MKENKNPTETLQNIHLEVLITSWKEPKTVFELVHHIEGEFQKLLKMKAVKSVSIFLIAPDRETIDAGIRADKLQVLRYKKDKGEGKPAAINSILKELTADITIFTDGDVKWGTDTIQKLLSHFADFPNVGAVTGRPMPINARTTLLGYWAWLTTQAGAHKTRLNAVKQDKFVNLSGYLFAIRKEYLPETVNKNLLAEDVYFSYTVYKKNGRVVYAPDALVYVLFPTNFKDWINQKKRAAGGDAQLHNIYPELKTMRSFKKEASQILQIVKYANTPKELLYGVLLVFARLYMWFLVFMDLKVLKKSSKDIWVRIESTKDL